MLLKIHTECLPFDSGDVFLFNIGKHREMFPQFSSNFRHHSTKLDEIVNRQKCSFDEMVLTESVLWAKRV